MMKEAIKVRKHHCQGGNEQCIRVVLEDFILSYKSS